MKRRLFLQLGASIGAGVLVPRSFAWSAPSLRLAHFPNIELAGTLIAFDGKPVVTPAALAALSSVVKKPLDAAIDRGGAGASPDAFIEMLWEKKPVASGEHYQWLINGRPYTECDPLRLSLGQRYRLRMMNATGKSHAVVLQDRTLQIQRVRQTAICGTPRNAIRLERYDVVDADIVMR